MLALFDFTFVLGAEEPGSSPLAGTATEDPELVAAFRAGDRAAFERVFGQWREPLYRFAFRYLRTEEGALDVVQEAFTRLLGCRGKLRPEQGIRSLLFTIALNLCYDELKKAERRRTGSLDALPAESGVLRDRATGHERKAELAEMEASLARVVDALPGKQREALLLKKVGGLTFEEVAETMGISVRYAKLLAQQALEHIVTAFDRQGYTVKGEFVA